MSVHAADLERASAPEVLAYAVQSYHPRLVTACSFQKEESVLFHILSEITPDFRVFTIDTGVLFPETIETQRRFEERYGIAFEVLDARRADGAGPWTAQHCCGDAKVAALEVGLADVDAWVTGLRREQGPTRAETGKLERDERRGIWKVSPLADWTEKQLWAYISEHELPYHPLHDEGYASIGCAPCTLPGTGREGRWSGEDKTECGIHVVPPSA